MDMAGKTVIVTGAGSGIGRALALAFAGARACVVCCGRRKDRLDETVRVIEAQGGRALALAADVTQPAEVRAFVQATLDRCGAIHVLFNNAGSFQCIGGVHEVDAALWWHDVTVNLYGPLLLIREILPHMLERNEGIIINMDGGRPVGGTGYACGKAGLMELTRILAEELKLQKSNVMVFRAGPGLVRTEMTELQANTSAGRKWIPSTKASFEAGRTRKPEDIARATLELVRIARPEHSGKGFNPDTDFTKF